MEINTNQVSTVTLEGVTPAKDFSVKDEASKVNTSIVEPKVNEDKVNDREKQAENLQVAVSQINDYVQNLQRNLQFTVDEATGKDVVTIIDSESKEVIRQLPTEEALELARRLAENRENGVQIVSTQV
mgnify:FL=1